MLSENSKININKDIVFREEEEGAFLFDPDSGRICYVNEPGMLIWKLCTPSKNLEHIIRKICADNPEISEERVKTDCIQFLEDLQRLGCLSIFP